MIKALTEVFTRVVGSAVGTTLLSSPVSFLLTKVTDITFTDATLTIAGLATAASLLTEGIIKPKNPDRCVDAVVGAIAGGTLLVLATSSNAAFPLAEMDYAVPFQSIEMRLER